MKARYRTKCPACKLPIKIGQEIQCEGWGRTVHMSCARPKTRPEFDEKVQGLLDLYERAGFR